MDAPSCPGAAAALAGDLDQLTRRWLDGFRAHILRLPRPVALDELGGTARGVLTALAGALGEPGIRPGHAQLREAEKRIAFAGGGFGQRDGSAFDIAAFVLALRDVLAESVTGPDEKLALDRLFDWFVALALEGYTTSRQEALRLRHRDELERGTPVYMVASELPALMLIGEPDASVLESAFGRLILSVVRVGARAAIVDGGGLMKPGEPRVLDALASFARHRKVKGAVKIVLVGLSGDVIPAWQDACGGEAIVVERFEDAIGAAGFRVSRA
jgi:hypothetical protein